MAENLSHISLVHIDGREARKSVLRSIKWCLDDDSGKPPIFVNVIASKVNLLSEKHKGELLCLVGDGIFSSTAASCW